MKSKILKELTIVIPIHEFNIDIDSQYLKNAINSIIDISQEREKNKNYEHYIPSKVLISYTDKTPLSEVEKITSEFKTLDIELVRNDTDKTNYSGQINFLTKKVQTTYFMILEMDDEISEIYLTNVVKYLNSYQNIKMFLPIVTDIDVSNNDDENINNHNKFIKFTNEAAFNMVVAKEVKNIGVLNEDGLKETPNFTLGGAIIDTETFNEIGGLKPSMKLAYEYEFLLRFTSNDEKIVVIPKMGYLHKLGRINSYFNILRDNQLTEKELAFWVDTAKKEYYIDEDRNIEYNEKYV